MRYFPLAAICMLTMALGACKPSTNTASAPVPLPIPSPDIPQAPSAPVVSPDPKEPESAGPGGAGAHQIRIFTGPMDLSIRLSTEDNFATAVMTDNSDRTLQMHRVPSSRGVRLEDGEGAAIYFRNGEGTVEFSPGNAIDLEEYRLP